MVEAGDPYAVVVSDEGVLDMSARGDIASVAAALGDRAVLL
ncbi:MAG TPA: nucleotidyltransferase family protein, partial [Arachnia sp.]|nr:nucleotidyltransferase family protein [Arachnia sp.]